MFRRKNGGGRDGAPPKRQGAFDALRAIALDATADLAGFSPAPDGRLVYGAVMDWTLEGELATLFALEDGTGSLYLSSGGGVIGGALHEAVREAVHGFIRAFEPFVGRMSGDPDGAPPPRGFTDLRALTLRGRLFVRATTADLGYGRHPMSSVFHAGQAVITALHEAPAVVAMNQPPS